MDLSTLDLVGHFAYGLLLVGMILVVQKKRVGFFLRFLGGLLWVGIGERLGMSSIWVWALVFMAIDMGGMWSWGRKGVPPE